MLKKVHNASLQYFFQLYSLSRAHGLNRTVASRNAERVNIGHFCLAFNLEQTPCKENFIYFVFFNFLLCKVLVT